MSTTSSPQYEWNPLEVVESAVVAGQVPRSKYGCDLKYAIILLNQQVLNEELFLSLWNEASLRMLVDGGGNHWKFLSRKFPDLVQFPHVVCGNFDSIRRDTLEMLRRRGGPGSELVDGDEDVVEIVHFPHEEKSPESDFMQAVNLPIFEERLNTLQIPRVLAYCETSGRFGQIMANVETLYKFGKKEPQLFLISSSSITFLLPAGRHKIKCGEKGHEFLKISHCALLPIGTDCTVSTQGLINDLNNETLSFGKAVVTNAIVVGIGSKETDQKRSNDHDKSHATERDQYVIVHVTNSHSVLWDMEFEFDNQLKNVW